jgi:hypothetical protein
MPFVKESTPTSKSDRKAKMKLVVSTSLREIKRGIPNRIESMLWGKAAGRCEFAGCNRQLFKSPVTQEQANIAEKAHMWAFSGDGPRGNAGVAKKKLNDLDNLLLVCHSCHRKIDQHLDGGRYPVSLLQRWKAEHERRVGIVTGIDPRKKSHIVLYGANIGDHSSPLKYADAADALFPKRYPADDRAIELGTVNSSFVDRDAEFWNIERKNLTDKFEKRVRERLASGEAEHLSVFGLAPQPLLILLGTLLTDIPKAEVFQLHREPQGWSWPNRPQVQPFSVRAPAQTSGQPVLVLSLSATVTDERIQQVIGPNVSIWSITIPTPNNDFMKSRAQLAQFRAELRTLLDRIKAAHGQTTTLHVFPANSVSACVEFGRVRQPKADMPWRLYDQVNARGGFIPAFDIPFGGTS